MKTPKHPLDAEFESLYQHHSREVWALSMPAGSTRMPQDIMQETFLRLWKQCQSDSIIVNPRAWLLRVAHNLAEDHAKSAFRRNGTQPPQTMNGVQGRDLPPLDAWPEMKHLVSCGKSSTNWPPPTVRS